MKSLLKYLAPLAAGSLVLSLPLATAQANSRFPYGNQLVVHPRNPDVILVRTTFGILLSEDHGKVFHWICEPLIGFTNMLDPGVGIFEDGTYAVAGTYGVAISRDNACSFPFAPGPAGLLTNRYAIDIAVDRDPKSAVIITNSKQLDDGSASPVQFFTTGDNGVTWTKQGDDLDITLTTTTLDTAPSDPNRVYVGGGFTAPDGLHGFVIRSDDRGKTWRPRVLLGGDSNETRVTSAFISGVDPQDPNRVYVRGVTSTRSSTLFVSVNGGDTFEEVKRTKSSMLGFAISPDGSKVAIGSANEGVQVAPRPAPGSPYEFEKRSTTPVTCLKWTTETLYACGDNSQSGVFVVGRSDDEARTFTPLLGSVDDIAATLTRCPEGSPYNNLCIVDWKRQQCLFASPGALEECNALADGGTGDGGGTNGAAPDGDACDVHAGAGASGSALPKAATGIAAVAFALGLVVRRLRRRR